MILKRKKNKHENDKLWLSIVHSRGWINKKKKEFQLKYPKFIFFSFKELHYSIKTFIRFNVFKEKGRGEMLLLKWNKSPHIASVKKKLIFCLPISFIYNETLTKLNITHNTEASQFYKKSNKNELNNKKSIYKLPKREINIMCLISFKAINPLDMILNLNLWGQEIQITQK